MSQSKPEAGDVWGNKFATYHVVEVNPIAAFCIVDDVYVRCENIYITYITEHLKYLGKAKAKMGDLFDVAED